MMILSHLRLKHQLDEDVVAVLEASLRRCLAQLSQAKPSKSNGRSKDALSGLSARLGKDGREDDIELLRQYVNATDIG